MKNIKKFIPILSLVLLLPGALFASTEEGVVESEQSNLENTADTVSPDEGAPDYVALIKEALKNDEACAPYAETISVVLEEHKVTLAGEVGSDAVKYRIEEIVRNTTYFEVINELTVSAKSGEETKDTEQSEKTDESSTET